jgi:hypothetical protein
MIRAALDNVIGSRDTFFTLVACCFQNEMKRNDLDRTCLGFESCTKYYLLTGCERGKETETVVSRGYA